MYGRNCSGVFGFSLREKYTEQDIVLKPNLCSVISYFSSLFFLLNNWHGIGVVTGIVHTSHEVKLLGFLI